MSDECDCSICKSPSLYPYDDHQRRAHRGGGDPPEADNLTPETLERIRAAVDLYRGKP